MIYLSLKIVLFMATLAVTSFQLLLRAITLSSSTLPLVTYVAFVGNQPSRRLKGQETTLSSASALVPPSHIATPPTVKLPIFSFCTSELGEFCVPGLPKSFPLARVGGVAPKDLWIPCPAGEPLKITEVITMEKIKSFRKGRLWLNVYLADDGELALTIKKSFPSKKGGWKHTEFLRPRFNDLQDLVQLLAEFLEYDQTAKVMGWTA
ncbi:MAG: hypothetical protein KKE29_21415 [Proteobacteria bacterium]|nr:hypothetical protein [Pseudomonadota bacterium]MBU4577166.1 hypothetical protein [Pseudomonadota bacterium]MBU4599132.1 hypothetical protein [Pseudomonadota bacterium]